MPHLTTYHAIQDGPLNLNFFGNQEKSVSFDPPNDIVLPSSGINRPVLSYRVDPSNDAKNLVFKVFIRQLNGVDVEVSSWTLSGTISRTVFEILNGAHLHKGSQKIIFRIEDTGGSIGSATVSDVIVWFIRDV